jgi:hypothetical protein
MNTELPPNERPRPSQPEALAERQSGPLSGAVIGGIALVVIGGIMLLQTTGIIGRLTFDFNWWALFMLIPISSIANSAWQTYKASGEQLTREVRTKFVIVTFMIMVCAALLFDLDWSRLWPIFLVLVGLGILIGGNEAR